MFKREVLELQRYHVQARTLNWTASTDDCHSCNATMFKRELCRLISTSGTMFKRELFSTSLNHHDRVATLPCSSENTFYKALTAYTVATLPCSSENMRHATAYTELVTFRCNATMFKREHRRSQTNSLWYNELQRYHVQARTWVCSGSRW